jgi:TetR/AcrR family transcriptional repressor of nem operon
MAFSKSNKLNKGCLMTNTVNELGEKADQEIMTEIVNFATNVKSLFIDKLESDQLKSHETIIKQSNYLMVSLQGLSVGSKMFSQEQLNDFIESTFDNL